jgi:hypothetical protein
MIYHDDKVNTLADRTASRSIKFRDLYDLGENFSGGKWR